MEIHLKHEAFRGTCPPTYSIIFCEYSALDLSQNIPPYPSNCPLKLLINLYHPKIRLANLFKDIEKAGELHILK